MKEYKDFWKRGFDFKGVSSSREYWMAVLFNLLFGWLLGWLVTGILYIVFNYFEIPYASYLSFVYITGYYIAMFIPLVAITVRRLHDINKSAWFLLLLLIPYLGGIAIFVFTLLDSNHDNNKWVNDGKSNNGQFDDNIYYI